MNAWQHLPNASHIDWVIESLKTNPRKWDAAWRVSWTKSRMTDHMAARHAAWDAMIAAARDADRDAAYDAAQNAAQNAAFDVSWKEADEIVFDVILALIAYDDCDQYLSISYDELLIYAVLSERPQAVLLLPLKCVQENECLATLA